MPFMPESPSSEARRVEALLSPAPAKEEKATLPRVKVLGLSATPIKGGNCEFAVEEALRAAAAQGYADTEALRLTDYQFGFCAGCDGCVRRVNKLHRELGYDVFPLPVREYNCNLKDDMEVFHRKLLECDGLVLAAPVYILTIPGQLKVWVDRCRTFVHDQRLRGKVAGGIALAFYRNAGQDTALAFMNASLLGMGLTLVSHGATVVSTRDGSGDPIRDTRFAVSRDELGLQAVRSLGRLVAQSALQMKLGREAMEAAGIRAIPLPRHLAPGG